MISYTVRLVVGPDITISADKVNRGKDTYQFLSEENEIVAEVALHALIAYGRRPEVSDTPAE